jgi:hypothetical protein
MAIRTGRVLFQVCVLTIVLAVGSVPASAEPVTLVYELNAGGLGVANVEVDVDLNEDGYSVATGLRTQGLAKLFTGFMIDSTSDGTIYGEGFHPRSHRIRSVWHGEDRHVEMRYRKDAAPRIKVLPPVEKEKREVVDPADTIGSVDALSGVLSLLMQVGERKFEAPVKIFDGRRLYALSVLSVEPRAVESLAYAGAGSAVRLFYERLGGRSKDSRFKEGGGTSEALLHVVPGEVFGLAVPVPVRLEVDTQGYGMIVVLLRQVRTDRLSAQDETHPSAACAAASEDTC